MSQEEYDAWDRIKTYEELLNTGETYIGVVFDLYCSKEGQLGWARRRLDLHQPSIHSLGDGSMSSATRVDISEILAQNARIEFKGRIVPTSLDILLNNEDTVLNILREVQAYNLLKTVEIK